MYKPITKIYPIPEAISPAANKLPPIKANSKTFDIHVLTWSPQALIPGNLSNNLAMLSKAIISNIIIINPATKDINGFFMNIPKTKTNVIPVGAYTPVAIAVVAINGMNPKLLAKATNPASEIFFSDKRFKEIGSPAINPRLTAEAISPPLKLK